MLFWKKSLITKFSVTSHNSIMKSEKSSEIARSNGYSTPQKWTLRSDAVTVQDTSMIITPMKWKSPRRCINSSPNSPSTELVPCVILSFDDEQILMWRGKYWKSMYPDGPPASVPDKFDIAGGLYGSGNAEVVKSNRVSRLNFHKKMSFPLVQADADVDVQARYNSFGIKNSIDFQESHVVSARTLKRASSFGSSYAEACTGNIQKKRAIEKEGVRQRVISVPTIRGKDYGKTKMQYPDYTETESGLQCCPRCQLCV